jgi:DNA-binding MarR family transcriptional regulator
VTADPDITRLIDRMEALGLVTRDRSKTDRRVVAIQIAPAGLELLAALDKPVAKLAVETMSALRTGEVQQLIGLLERVRGS